MKALVVHSGGLDSTVALYLAQTYPNISEVATVSFHYLQKHEVELDFAAAIASDLGIEHFQLHLPQWSTGTALTDPDHEVPEGHYAHENMKQTVVPNRNSIMLNIAAGLAIDIRAEMVVTGVHAGDHPVYPDCRPEFITQLNQLLLVANDAYVYVHAPFMDQEKVDIVLEGVDVDVPFEKTWSCYKGGVRLSNNELLHCGRCSTCVERAEAFHLAGVPDPTKYADPDYWKDVTDAFNK
jgi:7-cyano-7-deazaguanine synthase